MTYYPKEIIELWSHVKENFNSIIASNYRRQVKSTPKNGSFIERKRITASLKGKGK